jgi:ABC-type uncharacterized transport system involved in gliding motility auxiliary subunit
MIVATRTILGGWINMLYVPLALFFLGLVLAVAFDFKNLLEFFTMRTTKHGMNMGALILLTLVLLFSINYLGVRFDKTFDVTEEKLNSLSDQSAKVVNALTEDLTFYIFYKGEEARQQQTALKQNLTLYEEASPKIKIRSVNTYVDNALALQFLNDLNDKNRGETFLFVEYKGKKVRVDQTAPGQVTEEGVTSAIIRATRSGTKAIYFLTGHGERDLKGEEPDSLKQLTEALEGASYKVESLNFAEKPRIPEDASAIAIVGPLHPLMDAELEMLRNYSRAGGRLLIAADPGQRNNIALLTKSLGIEFKNNFVFNQISQIVGRGLATAIGLDYDSTNDITKNFRNGEMTIFDLASEVIPDPGLTGNFLTKTLVKTHESAFTVADVKSASAAAPKADDLKPVSLAVLVEENIEANSPPAKEGEAPPPVKRGSATLVFGDSDFMANKSLYQGLNRDLALNSFSFLAQETDLISIRPKQPKGTQLILTEYSQLGLVAAGVSLPLVLLIASAVLWFRRRGA